MKTKGGAMPVAEDSWVRALKSRSSKKPLSGSSRTQAGSDKVSRFISENKLQTPFLIVDLDGVEKNFRMLRAAMPQADVFYAVKANPAPEVIERLVALGSSFDVASPVEVDLVLNAGARPHHVSFGNTIKKERDIAFAYKRGVRLYAFDSEAELIKLARSAPGARVFCRILTSCDGADWPLSRKFGCEVEMARDLLLKAHQMGLEPVGVSFHVGSQQTRLDQWELPLKQAADLFAALREKGIALSLINLGGGLPTKYQESIAPVRDYGSAIMAAVQKHFGDALPQMIIEPGRSMVGDTGFIEAEVVLISKKSYQEDVRWVYLDIGKFSGLAETHDEAIKYRMETMGRKGATGPVILAGPSCDSVDILYEKYQYQLPLSLQVGDKIRIHATGAYTSTYSSVGFNGFPPLATYCV